MEKKPVAKSMNKMLRLLPKAAQASVSFHYSPGRDKLKMHPNKGLPMIPSDTKMNYETQDPTSPKISCIGQIKQKNKLCTKKKPNQFNLVSYTQPEKISKARSVGPTAGLKKIFSTRRNSDASVDHSKPPLPDRAPTLNHIRKFASSRDSLAHFDWTTTTTTHLCCDGEDDAVIPFSAPILLLEPRKEINLWRRRTMPQPKPLQLNIVRPQ